MPETKSTPPPPIDATLTIHRQTSIEFIRNAGAFAVRVNAKTKSPTGDWSPRNNNKDTTELLLREAIKPDYTANLGVHLFGPLLDVDIDGESPALREALERFLPPCNHIWGTERRPRTHRVYQLKEDFSPDGMHIVDVLKKLDGNEVELRGGPPTAGKYSVVPGSIHPLDGCYLWADLKKARSSLTIQPLSTLLKAIRLSCAVAVMAPYWQEGIRNDLTMALSGLLFRLSKLEDELGDGDFRMDKAMSEQFLAVLLDVTGDDGKDEYARKKTFEQTWRKAENDAPTTGGNKLVQLTGDEMLVHKLYSLLSDSKDIQTLEEFVQRFAIWIGPGIVIDMDAASKGVHKPFLTRQQFCNSFGHRYVINGGKRKLAADLLFHVSLTTRLAGVTFVPGAERIVDTREGRKVNQWAGFAIEPWPEPVADAMIEPFLKYVREIICSDNDQIYQWVIGWIAHIFKEPSFKSGTALVLVGLPGIGKSFLGEHFLNPIIGTHAVTTSSIDRAVQGFNALFDNRIFVQCDEALSNRQRVTAARLKSLITDPVLIVEPKGIDPFEKPNHMRLLFTSNETRDAVFLTDGMDDRRYTVLEVSDRRKNQHAYWTALAKWAGDKENLAKVHRYLIDLPYDRAVIGKPLRTEAKIVMQEHSMPMFDRWLQAWVSRNHPIDASLHTKWHNAPIEDTREIRRDGWPLRVDYNILALDYARQLKNEMSRSSVLNGQQILQEFRKRKLKVDELPQVRLRVREFDQKEGAFVTERIRLHCCPTRATLMEYLGKKYGVITAPVEEQEPMELDVVLDNKKHENEEF